MPHQAQGRKPRSRRVLFTYGQTILVALSGSSLLYFGFLAQRIPKLSSDQIAAEVAASHAYTTSAAKQGVMFGFDAAHTNYNPYEQTITPGNVSRLTPLWSFGIGDQIHSSPTVAGGMIYVGAGGSRYDGKLSVFDASCYTNCQPLWSFNIGGSYFFSPAVAGGIVYVSGDNGSKLYAFDASCRQNCTPLWSFDTGNRIVSSPVVAGGIVYVSAENDTLYAFGLAS